MHDLLLGLAGRLDDDALADARELLASAEVDRTLEYLVGCLVAGRIAVTSAQRAELEPLRLGGVGRAVTQQHVTELMGHDAL